MIAEKKSPPSAVSRKSTLSLGGVAGLNAAANVEEVKTKVSKMFSAASRPSVPLNASLPGFLKKK